MNQHKPLTPRTYLHNNEYQIIRNINRSSTGYTYLAINNNIETSFIIKEFIPSFEIVWDDEYSSSFPHSLDEANELKDRFKKKAYSISELQHNSIIKIRNVFEDDGRTYYVRDRANGLSLETIVSESGPIPIDNAVALIIKVGNIIKYLHECNIHHLDINPSNIFVDPIENNITLADFGLPLNNINIDTQKIKRVWSYVKELYSPPEFGVFGHHNPSNELIDVYSLAATFYFLINGTPPPELWDLKANSLTFSSEVPDLIQKAIIKGMSYETENRYKTIADFVLDLDQHKNKKTKKVIKKTKSRPVFSTLLHNLYDYCSRIKKL